MGKIVNEQVLRDTYNKLLADQEDAVQVELLNKEPIVRERAESEIARIDQEVEAELREKASAPFKAQIALLETFFVEEPTAEEPESEVEDAESVVIEETEVE